MKINHLRSYALGFAATLIAIPGYTALHAQTAQQPATLYSADAQLTHPLNSGNAKVGQAVTAKLTSDVKAGGSTALPKGATLMGKVEQVNSANGGESISIVFDQARVGNGQVIPIKATILGAYPPMVYDDDAATPPPGTYMNSQPRTIPSDYSVTQEPGLLSDVSLTSSAKSDVSGVFTSSNHSFKLNSGTRLQLAIAPESGCRFDGQGQLARNLDHGKSSAPILRDDAGEGREQRNALSM